MPLISQVEQKKCFAGNVIDKSWTFRFYVEKHVLLLNLWENVKIMFFFMKMQVTWDWSRLHEWSLLNLTETNRKKQLN